ncbi:RNA-directed DNA polymerase [Modicisalibacter xianhensis]|uniref:RNA-directed DNA polymerase n=1 Tax=Modicisalibacter xianhensis TaxID=442341 RepID=A0A4R8G9D7_9GAMM|nr:group II intron reverse transcriptase/maturase [Halomonas xianhensis]TDX32930.1 RNA-directed DNA polymerase [Halomonas xianhensis]
MDTAYRDVVSPQWNGWHHIEWRQAHQRVRRLQVRIAKATKECNWRKVRQLQRLITRSTSAKAVAIKRVISNRGYKTPGVDGETWSTPETKWQAMLTLHVRGYKAMPMRRVHIPKASGGKRPLGIPTMRDRAMQALHLLALEPVSETMGDLNSYGFRPYRSTKDAMAQCCNALSRPSSPQWVLEGDIRSCFDNISHEWLLKYVPIDRNVLEQWLKAGVVDAGQLLPTTAGTPQGGIISPVLANLTLDGIEGMLKEHFVRRRKVNFIRYADDWLVTGDSKETVETARQLIRDFLAVRGLELSQQKTRVTHICEGFDFLGWTFRKFDNDWRMVPSKSSRKRLYAKVREVVRKHRTSKQVSLIAELNPILRGWAQYHRNVSATRIFNQMDHMVWQALWRWAQRRHPNKGKRWIKARYWSRKGSREWVFCEGEHKLFYLSGVKCNRHVKIKSDANLYDPADEEYYERLVKRQMAANSVPKLNRIWRAQNGECPVCNQPITTQTEWQVHHKVWKTMGGSDAQDNLVILHDNCHRQVHARNCTSWPPAWLETDQA